MVVAVTTTAIGVPSGDVLSKGSWLGLGSGLGLVLGLGLGLGLYLNVLLG